jgi:hypothetical protein
LFSDGIVDRFNYETNRRLGSKKLNEMFIFMENLIMNDKGLYCTEMMNEHQKMAINRRYGTFFTSTKNDSLA